jgi:pimeloyl-ACP methyl ester carboxylesterase
MSGFGNDVGAVLDALERDRIVLIGHSMGGPVVLEAARGLPEERLVGVIAVDSLHDLSEALDASMIDKQIRRFNRDYKAATARLIRKVLFLPSSNPTLVERVVRGATSTPERIAISALRNAWAYDARQAAGELRAPIRAINTDLFPTNREANQDLCHDYRVVIMESLGHYPMLEDPEGFNQALEGVLKELGS